MEPAETVSPASAKKDPEMFHALVFVGVLGVCFVWTLFTSCACRGHFEPKQVPSTLLPAAHAIWLLSTYKTPSGRTFAWVAFALGAAWLWMGIEGNIKYAL